MIKERLNDPKSAVFRNVLISRVLGPPVVIGEVNCKNVFGGYAGYMRFIVAEDIKVIEGVDMTNEEFTKLWDSMAR